ncbi:MAG: alanine--tRNA ligase [Chloroflexi bacterium]|nr:alanine--tRNA ligase [Chloroflexota bacterium]
MSRPTLGDEIREAYLRFYEERDHLRHRAASLIPIGDPTLLLTNSGMAQFKAFFSGEATPPHPRITTAQKCFRTTDIEEVGDATHLTTFEMLGDFSFGDYFKREACQWALELMTGVLEFPRERLYITIHESDDECEQIWLGLGVPPERISRFGDEHNWWGPAGDEGPCGPCSELHYYRGDMADVPPAGNPRRGHWGPNVHDDFAELYNLVFTQYYHQLDGTRTELPSKNIDTGMGLERTAAAVQGKTSVYETDILRPLIDRIEELSKKKWGGRPETDRAMGVVADHARSSAFLISDGVVPENTGRGYVLRRLIRRCVRFGRQLGVEGPFMGEVAQVVIDRMGHIYPELVEQAPFIHRVLELEERQFAATVDQGSTMLASLIRERSQAVSMIATLGATESPWTTPTLQEGVAAARHLLDPLMAVYTAGTAELLWRATDAAASIEGATREGMAEWWDTALRADWQHSIRGHEAFFLSDTYGFPLEVTEEIAAEHGMTVDREGFEREMEQQRRRARAATRFGGDAAMARVFDEMDVDRTVFVGYDALEADTVVAGLLEDGVAVNDAAEGAAVGVVLATTPLYAEAGGQVGDRGRIEGDDLVVEIDDTQSPVEGIVVHHGRVAKGRVAIGDRVSARVDTESRGRIKRNHTATHLLHAALRHILGKHVRQHGSLVAPDRLRFDFTHVSPLDRDELMAIQRLVNEKIRESLPIRNREIGYRDAIDAGALAFFGDKYGDAVRTLEIGDGTPFSYELCGGTHCRNTGEIGSMLITSESSIGAGLRRIEAATGDGVEALVAQRFGVLDSLAAKLQSPMDELERRTDALLAELDATKRRLAGLERQALFGGAGGSRSELETHVLDSVETNLREQATKGKVSDVARDTLVDEHGRLRADLVARKGDMTWVYVVREGPTEDQLRELGDRYRNSMKSTVICLAKPAPAEERPTVIFMLTPDLVERGFRAGDLAKAAGRIMGGGGGGRADIGQAGGRDSSELPNALSSAVEMMTADSDSESS